MDREEEHKLAVWCMEQAKLYSLGKLSKAKVKQLKDINFPFDYYLSLFNQHNLTSIDKRGIKKLYILERWNLKKKGKSEWETEIVITPEQFEMIDPIVNKYPKANFRLLNDDFEIVAMKIGKDKTLNFKNETNKNKK